MRGRERAEVVDVRVDDLPRQCLLVAILRTIQRSPSLLCLATSAPANSAGPGGSAIATHARRGAASPWPSSQPIRWQVGRRPLCAIEQARVLDARLRVTEISVETADGDREVRGRLSVSVDDPQATRSQLSQWRVNARAGARSRGKWQGPRIELEALECARGAAETSRSEGQATPMLRLCAVPVTVLRLSSDLSVS